MREIGILRNEYHEEPALLFGFSDGRAGFWNVVYFLKISVQEVLGTDFGCLRTALEPLNTP